jgi:hypothetical protein
LDPLLISPDGNITSVFDRGELFRGQAKQMPSARSVKLFQILNYGFNLYVAGLTIFWIIWLGRDLLQRNIPLWPLACFSALSLLLCLLVKPILDALVVGRGVNIGGAPLGLAFLFSGGGLLVAAGYWTSMKRVMQANVTLLVFLLFGPTLFLFYIVQWWSGIDRIADWSFGDDWSRYQLFAFRIAAWGDILSGGGEPIFYYQPFYRYIVAFFHWIFGKAVVAQQLFDVWCVLGAADTAYRRTKAARIMAAPNTHHTSNNCCATTALPNIQWKKATI